MPPQIKTNDSNPQNKTNDSPNLKIEILFGVFSLIMLIIAIIFNLIPIRKIHFDYIQLKTDPN